MIEKTGQKVKNVLVSTCDPVKLYLGACFPDFLKKIMLTKEEMAVITKKNLFDGKKKVTVITGLWYKSPQLHYLSDALLHECYQFFANELNNFPGDPKGAVNVFFKKIGWKYKFLILLGEKIQASCGSCLPHATVATVSFGCYMGI